MKRVSTVGIDLAKSIFQICGTDRGGTVIFNKKVTRAKLIPILEKLEKEEDFLIAMEACGGAHHIARSLLEKGYNTKIISAQFVKPFVKSNKNDAKDAEAIAEASRRPQMRFVGVKSVRHQDIQSIHRVREGYVKRKTALANEIRGLLLEYGIPVSQGILNLKKRLPELVEDSENVLTSDFRSLLRELYEELQHCFDKVEDCAKKLKLIHSHDEDCQRLSKIDGVGLITSTAVIAAVGDPKAFTNGRQFSAWLGLTPRQYSSGGKTKILGISKRGDSYIRKNLIHGCRSVVNHSKTKTDKRSRWIQEKLPSKGVNKVSVALANKTARVIWAILAKKEEYRGPRDNSLRGL